MSDMQVDDFVFDDLETEVFSPASLEIEQDALDALLAELARDAAADSDHDLAELYTVNDPGLTDLDTQEIEIDPQAVQAWLDSLDTSSSFDLERRRCRKLTSQQGGPCAAPFRNQQARSARSVAPH